MTIEELRASLAEKVSRGVKQVRVSTVLADLPETMEQAFPDVADASGMRRENRALRDRVKELERERRNAAAKAARAETRLREQHAAELAAVRAERNGKGGTPAVGLEALAEMSEDDPKRYGGVAVKGVLVGTAEAAAMLNVERPRIGRWVSLGKLPPPIAELRATPVWLRSQIESKRGDVESRRKPRRESVEA